MCDTVVALRNSTADGSVIFAKNSDRDPNEAHHLLLVPAATHETGSQVQCTYIQIPQVNQTNSVLLAKPFWIWGAEMGCNEHGVVIGNEAIFSKEPPLKQPGLIGMDFLRLALERASTADEALRVMIELLEIYDQSGNCGFAHPSYYHNSYLIADREDAWVFETVGKRWAAEKVNDVGSISNELTIRNEWDMTSPDLKDYAIQRGWCHENEEFDFSRCYSDFIYTKFSNAHNRRACTLKSAQANKGKITVKTMMEVLRSHAGSGGTPGAIDRPVMGADVCNHAGFGPIRISQSTGSFVVQVKSDGMAAWFTGTSAPCTSVFKPVWIDAGLPSDAPNPKGTFDEYSLWWKHELLHREVLKDHSTRLFVYSAERDQLENRFIERVEQSGILPAEERLSISKQCYAEALSATEKWTDEVRKMPVKNKNRFYYAWAWQRINQEAKLPALS
jgi:secernin